MGAALSLETVRLMIVILNSTINYTDIVHVEWGMEYSKGAKAL
jgi:hypothetical protein